MKHIRDHYLKNNTQSALAQRKLKLVFSVMLALLSITSLAGQADNQDSESGPDSTAAFKQTAPNPDSTRARQGVRDSIIQDVILESAGGAIPGKGTVEDDLQINVDEELSAMLEDIQDKTILFEEMKLQYSGELDTLSMMQALPVTRNLLELVGNAVDASEGSMNLRSLEALDRFTIKTENSLRSFEDKLDKNQEKLRKIDTFIQEVKSDSLFVRMLEEAELNPLIADDIDLLRASFKEMDQDFEQDKLVQLKYQAAISDVKIRLLALRNRVIANRNILKNSYRTKEINYPWEPVSFPVSDSAWSQIKSSNTLNQRVLKNFFSQNTVKIFLFVLLIAGVSFLFRKWTSTLPQDASFLGKIGLLRRFPFLSSVILILPLGLILFRESSIVFLSLLLLFQTLALIPLLYSHYTRRLFWALVLPLPLYFIVMLKALQWTDTYQDRWLYLVFASIFVFLGIYVYRQSPRENPSGATDGNLFLRIFSVALVVMSLISLVANITGRYSLAKVLVNAGVLNFYLGIALYFFVQVVWEFVYLFLETGKSRDHMATSVLGYLELQGKVRNVVAVIALGIWLYILLLQTGYLATTLDYVMGFLNDPRTVGDVTFTFSDILVFLVILLISVYLANGIGYLASLRDQRYGKLGKKKIGSSALLLRLAVLTGGFLLAVSATGIPLDRITIVLGALSVGIGFGLQTIVNNLVSGVILAFEKPLQLGDRIKIGELEGVVRDIGIRASKITNYDGAEVIIPNGDLLSNHLINWTHSNETRRLELIIGVHYDSDMELVSRLILEELDRDIVLKDPPPQVIMQTFNDSSVDFRVLFWIPDLANWVQRQDEVMRGIWASFKKNGVEIPYPQMDLHVRDTPMGEGP